MAEYHLILLKDRGWWLPANAAAYEKFSAGKDIGNPYIPGDELPLSSECRSLWFKAFLTKTEIVSDDELHKRKLEFFGTYINEIGGKFQLSFSTFDTVSKDENLWRLHQAAIGAEVV